MAAVLAVEAPELLIDRLGQSMLAFYADLEARLLTDIARRLAAGAAATPDLLARLQAVRELEDLARSLLTSADPATVAARIIDTAERAGVAVAAAQVGLGGSLARPIPSASAINAIVALRLDLENRLTDMHLRIVRGVADIYRDLAADLLPNFIIGVETVQATRARLADALLDRGLSAFTDASGRQWRIGTYAEMVTRTTGMRALNEATIARFQDLGIGLITPVGSRTACDKCAPWQGKVLSTDGTLPGLVNLPSVFDPNVTVTVRVDATLDHARASGLFHPNCRDVSAPVMPGAGMPVQLPPGFDAASNQAEVAAVRRLRTLEVRVRDAKRRLQVALALGLDEQVPALRRVVRDRQAEIRRHVTTTGVTRRPYREQLTFSDGGTANPRG